MCYPIAVTIVSIQECKSAKAGPIEIPVPSSSDPSLVYWVLIADRTAGISGIICECKGYTYNGRCRHQQEALDYLCEWTELIGPEKQTPEQREDMICPRCSDDTYWAMEFIDEPD